MYNSKCKCTCISLGPTRNKKVISVRSRSYMHYSAVQTADIQLDMDEEDVWLGRQCDRT